MAAALVVMMVRTAVRAVVQRCDGDRETTPGAGNKQSSRHKARCAARRNYGLEED
jgi:hypothetical protein